MVEKRKFPRRKFSRSVSYLTAGDYFQVMGLEIGEGGFSLLAPQLPDENRPLVVNFQIPGFSFFSVRAEIRNHRTGEDGQYVIGCAFVNLSQEKRREIRTFVSNMAA